MVADDAQLGPLPRGRHSLSRDEVRDSQRRRILLAMTVVMARKGYVATSVADVLTEAGVSRSTFYELFQSKEDCFAGVYDDVAQAFVDAAGTSLASGADPADPLSALLRAYLDLVADRPAQARVMLVESLAAGPEVARRRAAAQARYEAAFSAVLGPTEADRFAARVLVSAIRGMTTDLLVAEDLDGIRALHGPLVELARRLGHH